MEKQDYFLKIRNGLVAVVLIGSIWSCGNDDNAPLPPTPDPVTVSFTASSPVVSEEGNTAVVTFTNTSTGTVSSFLWNFGAGATPPAVEVSDTSSQEVTYDLTAMEQSVTVSLEAQDASDASLGSASESVTLPMLIAAASIPPAPAREACTLTFEEDPVCFCSDPANADDSLCASVAMNGDLESAALSTNFDASGFAEGLGGWDLRSSRDGSGASSTMTRVEENGNNFLEVVINNAPDASFGSSDAPWVIQLVSEEFPNVDGANDEGWPVTGGVASQYMVLVDIYSDTDGARVGFTPEVACAPCSAVNNSNASDPANGLVVLEEGWNQVGMVFENTNTAGFSGQTLEPFFKTVRGPIQLNYPENVGVRLAVDNYRLIPIGFMPPPDEEEPVQGSQINPLTFDAGGEPTFTFSFAGASSNQVIANPFPGGANPDTNNVLEIVNEGIETFDGHGWGFPAGSELDLTGTNKVVRALVYSDEVTAVRFQVQGGLNGELILRATAPHTGSGWEALDFDFNAAEISGDGGQANAGDIVAADGVYGESIITVGPDVQSPGTFYVDSIGVVDETAPQQANPITFDAGAEPSFTFSFAGASSNAIVDNPFPEGANPDMNNVLQIVNEGVETFDGHGWGYPGGLELDLTGSNKVVRVLVYSDEAIGVRFQAQGGQNDALIVFANAAHTGSGWEAIDFDFNTAIISGDGGQANAGDTVAADGIYAESIITMGPDVQSPGTFYIDNVGVLE